MKKLLFIALSMLISLPTMANDEIKNWRFENNEDGECIVNIEIPTQKDQTAAIKAIKVAINKVTLSSRSLIASTDSTLLYHIGKNTKMRYNPFAGNFTENMKSNLLVTYSNNSIKLQFTELTLVCEYNGYGSNTTSKSFSARIDQYNTCTKKLNDGSIKGKEKKECKSEIKNINGELNVCQKEFDSIIEEIKNAL